MGKHDASKKHAHKQYYPIYYKTPDGRELRDCGYSEEEAIQRCLRRLATANSKRRKEYAVIYMAGIWEAPIWDSREIYQ